MATGFAVQAHEGIWSPSSTLTDHQGGSLAPESDFFVAPPQEIGEVKSAHTSLKKGVKAKTVPVRIAIAAVAGVVGFVAAMGLDRVTGILLVPAGMTGTPDALWAAVFGLLPAYIAWRKTAFKHFCQFVGAEGCAQLRCEGEREHIVENSVFRFKDASAVSTSMVRHTRNGMYSYTGFYFYWYPPDGGKAIYQIAGTHGADSKTPPAGNPYNFARAAEAAWYGYLTPKIDAELAHNGFIKFYMGNHRWTRIGRGFIEFVDKQGTVSRCEAADIGSAKLAAGYFTICRQGAKSSRFDLFNTEGVFRFDYGTVHNARLLLVAFEKFLDIKVQ